MLVTKVLQVMSLGNKFGDKEEFMKQFNTLVEENNDKMTTFYRNLLDKDKPCEATKPDAKVPSQIYQDSLALMAFMMSNGKKPSQQPQEAQSQQPQQVQEQQ